MGVADAVIIYVGAVTSIQKHNGEYALLIDIDGISYAKDELSVYIQITKRLREEIERLEEIKEWTNNQTDHGANNIIIRALDAQIEQLQEIQKGP